MSASNPAPPPQAAAPPKRNPVEKLIVRGLIAILLVLVGVEFAFSRSHASAMQALQEKIAQVEKDSNAPAVHEADVKAAVGDKKPISSEELKGRVANGAQRLDIYEWFTLNPFNQHQRRLYVYYGHVAPNDKDGAEVLEVQPDDKIAEPAQPSPEEIEAMKNAPPVAMPTMMGGPPGRGGPGAPGGRPAGRRGGPPVHDPATGDAKADSDKPADDKDADDKPKDDDKDQ